MNIAYFRQSTFEKEKTIENVKKVAKELGLLILGETTLPSKNGVAIHLCNPNWIGNLIASDHNLIGLLPCTVVVVAKANKVLIGVGSATIMGGVSQNPAIVELAKEVEAKLKELVHKAAGVGPLKPIRIKLYSTMTCPYCKMEAAWLDQNEIKYDQVHIDLNPKEAEEVITKTGQMGVPVTEIEYDNGENEYIIGFDRARLEEVLIKGGEKNDHLSFKH
jgi:glutaredoxin